MLSAILTATASAQLNDEECVMVAYNQPYYAYQCPDHYSLNHTILFPITASVTPLRTLLTTNLYAILYQETHNNSSLYRLHIRFLHGGLYTHNAYNQTLLLQNVIDIALYPINQLLYQIIALGIIIIIKYIINRIN